ncbi:hypothetical protein MTR67_043057 [Solanum verrucosum]|uniref:Uncharacterized protein n=1 Tax=Solanum verrucosum TaxID=315347 RepID=A0AAF0UNQ9_SOLVR|nr:hypothetical protein MTR67_043057 [Solanum verrucosum]
MLHLFLLVAGSRLTIIVNFPWWILAAEMGLDLTVWDEQNGGTNIVVGDETLSGEDPFTTTPQTTDVAATRVSSTTTPSILQILLLQILLL